VKVEGDHIYFCRRATEEREAAMKAPHQEARRAHIELAGRYEELATAITRHVVPLCMEPSDVA